MPTRYRRTSPLQKLVVPMTLIALTGYFVWHARAGDFGSQSMARLSVQRAGLEQELAALETQRAALEARVERLRPGALDADLLDERARAKLNLARADEIVIFHEAGAPSGFPVFSDLRPPVPSQLAEARPR